MKYFVKDEKYLIPWKDHSPLPALEWSECHLGESLSSVIIPDCGAGKSGVCRNRSWSYKLSVSKNSGICFQFSGWKCAEIQCTCHNHNKVRESLPPVNISTWQSCQGIHFSVRIYWESSITRRVNIPRRPLGHYGSLPLHILKVYKSVERMYMYIRI